MGFKREVLPPLPRRGDELTADMAGIGMLFAAEASDTPNIENTLFFASQAGMLEDDFRVLSVLVTWLDVHSRWVNADRLITLVSSTQEARLRAFWAAIATWKKKDRRFARLRRLHRGEPVDALPVGQEFQLERYGSDLRFEGTALKVDAKLLRDRPADVLQPMELAKRHAAYRWRVLLGPTYRADLIAELERRPSLTVSELARAVYSSIGAAWEAKHDYELLRPAGLPAADSP